jgi:hypothetical protein
MKIKATKILVFCILVSVPILNAGPVKSREQIAKHTEPDIRASVPGQTTPSSDQALEPLAAVSSAISERFLIDDISVSGDLSTAQARQVLAYMLQRAQLANQPEARLTLPVINEASIRVNNLRLNDSEGNDSSSLVISQVTLEGIKVDTSGRISIGSISVKGVDARTMGSMFYDKPHVLLSQVQIAEFHARGIKATGYGRSEGNRTRSEPFSYQADTLEFSDASFLERPLRSSASAPQWESRFSVQRFLVEGLKRGSFDFFRVNSFQSQSNSKPSITLKEVSASGANWRPYTYLLGHFAMRESFIGRDMPAPRETVSQLWPGGPFDFGLAGFDMRDFKLDFQDVHATLDRLAFITQKTRDGKIRQFEFPRGSLVIRAKRESNAGSDDSASGFITWALGLINLDQFAFSWQARGSFDAGQDLTQLTQFSLNLPQLFQVDLAFQLRGVENARNKLIASDTFGRIWGNVSGPAGATNSVNTERSTPSGGRDANADRRARQRVVNGIVGGVTLASLSATLSDLGGLTRGADAFSTARAERQNGPRMDNRAARCFVGTELSRRVHAKTIVFGSAFLWHNQEIIEGLVSWIKVGSRLEVTLATPIRLADLSKAGRNRQPSFRVRTGDLTSSTDCRP